MLAVAAHVPEDGEKISALASSLDEEPTPPATRTRPSGRRVAVW
jgi:hypothetical protein